MYSGEGFTVDRWRAQSAQCYVTVESGVLKLEGSGTSTRVDYQQKLEWPLTEAATLSVLTGPVVGACSAYVLTAAGTDRGIGMTLKANTLNVMTVSSKDIGAVGFGVPDGGRIDLRAVKLELGGASTLAHQEPDGSWVVNEIPDWAEMLRKCQRYCCLYRAQGGSSVTNNVLLGAGLAVTATTARVVLHTPVPLRAKPTVSMTGLSVWCDGRHTAVTAAEVLWGTSGNCVALQLTCESGAFTSQAPCMLEFLTADGWLNLSAEL